MPGVGGDHLRNPVTATPRCLRHRGMKILIAGATGAHRKATRPAAGRRGHEVVGLDPQRGPQREAVRALGARPVIGDALDPDAVARRWPRPSRR